MCRAVAVVYHARMCTTPTPTAQDFCQRGIFRSGGEHGIQVRLPNSSRIYDVMAAGHDAMRIVGHGVNVTITMVNGRFVPESEVSDG